MRRYLWAIPVIIVSFALLIGQFSKLYSATSGVSLALTSSANYNVSFAGDGAASPDVGHKLGDGSQTKVADINGDGFDDIIAADTEDAAGIGAVYIVFGGISQSGDKILSSAETYSLKLTGVDTTSHFGYTVAAGDVNGDGKADLLVQGDDPGNTYHGSVYVFFSTIIEAMRTNGTKEYSVSSTSNWNIRYDAAASADGLAAKPAGQKADEANIVFGDLNRDGKNDLLIGAKGAESGAGAVYVFFSTLVDDVGTSTGAAKPLADTASYTAKITGDPARESLSGTGIAVADINEDTYNDLAIGTYTAASTSSLYILDSLIFSTLDGTTGNSIPLTTATNYTVVYEATGPLNFVLGDFNGDNKADLVASSPTSPSEDYIIGIASTRFAQLKAANTTGLQTTLTNSAQYTFRHDAPTALTTRLGTSLLIGDINNDNKDDLIVSSGTSSAPENYNVWVFFSTLLDNYTTLGNRATLVTDPNTFNVRFSNSANATTGLAGAASGMFLTDFNSDGKNDFVTGNPFGTEATVAGTGFVTGFDSSLFSNLGVTTDNILDPNLNTNFSFKYYSGVASAALTGNHGISFGKINGDSAIDMIITSKEVDLNDTDSGAIWVIYNKTNDSAPPVITVPSPPAAVAKPGAISITGNVADATSILTSLQISVDETGIWADCTITDGSLDESAEDFVCSVASSLLTDATHTFTVRSIDSFSNIATLSLQVAVATEVPTTTIPVTTTAPIVIHTTIAPTPYCGNNKKESGEECDGSAGLTSNRCIDYDTSYTYGTVSCSNLCKVDITNCAFTAPTTTPTTTNTPSATPTPSVTPTTTVVAEDLLAQYMPWILAAGIVFIIIILILWIRSYRN